VRLGENPSALLECLHLEALGVHVSLRDSLVSLGGCCHLMAWSSEDHRAEEGNPSLAPIVLIVWGS
jgi:hypothetical protein